MKGEGGLLPACKKEIMIKKLQTLRKCIRELPAITREEVEVKEEALKLVNELASLVKLRFTSCKEVDQCKRSLRRLS